MAHVIGERVGAILSANDTEVKLLGYGVYEGDFEAPTGPFGASWERFDEIALETWGIEEFERRKADGCLRPKNPRIRLDNGERVWGQECWWGPEGKIKESIGDRNVIFQ